MSFESWKLLHVVCALLWLGPATGAYWVLIRIRRHLVPAQVLRLEKTFEEVLIVEHVAFAALIASGVMMWRSLGTAWDAIPWLKLKIMLVAGVFLIEILDIAVSHVYFREVLRRARAGDARSWERFQRVRRVFYAIVIPILLILITGIIALAVIRPD